MSKIDINARLVRFEQPTIKEEIKIYPTIDIVKNWQFKHDEVEEAILCAAIAQLAEKTGVSVNSLQHLFPAILKMLNSNSIWTK